MKWWKKILLAVFILLLLLQIPGIYSRYSVYRLSENVARLERRPPSPIAKNFKDYSGLIHVHSFLGEHSTGTFEDIIESARANALDYVVMTEHVSGLFDTSEKTLHDVHGGVLFVGGNEVLSRDGDRFLVVPGFEALGGAERLSTNELVEASHRNQSLIFQPYPEKNRMPDVPIEGVEVFSLNTNSKNMNIPLFLMDALWSYRSYPELTLARHFRRPVFGMKRFDEMAAKGRTTLFAGTDAHSNIGLYVGDDSNNRLLNLKFDEYQSIFRLVRNHVLIDKKVPLGRDSLLDAIREGRVFISFDVIGDGSGFYFGAFDGRTETAMGGETPFTGTMKLEAIAPKAARFVVFRNGGKYYESGITDRIELKIDRPGIYRTELYRDGLGSPFDVAPWIISNAVYVRDGAVPDSERSGDLER